MNSRTRPFNAERVGAQLGARGLDPLHVGRYATLVQRLDTADPGRVGTTYLASAPGRTELAGNHTDHNRGRVLAASINLDSIAAVVPRDDSVVVLRSEGFEPVELDADDLDPRPGEAGTTAALVRGVMAGFANRGYRTGGFSAAASSTVLPGSGLSSSASFEVLVGQIENVLYNDGSVGPTAIAQIGRYAENAYFDKPCGLMDQVACATGGGVAIDFADESNPIVETVDIAFAAAGLALVVVDTGGSHADLTGEYAAIPADMRAIAAALGGEQLRDVAPASFYADIRRLRSEIGDRAVARAIHFFGENQRVADMVDALKAGRIVDYIGLMGESGHSSGLFLQNCAPAVSTGEQGVVVALALTERFLNRVGLRSGVDAATRVHGGGFAGTIQTLLPIDRVGDYADALADVFGPESSTVLSIRGAGAIAFQLEEA